MSASRVPKSQSVSFKMTAEVYNAMPLMDKMDLAQAKPIFKFKGGEATRNRTRDWVEALTKKLEEREAQAMLLGMKYSTLYDVYYIRRSNLLRFNTDELDFVDPDTMEVLTASRIENLKRLPLSIKLKRAMGLSDDG